MIVFRRWRDLLRAEARAQPERRVGVDLVQHVLQWDAIVDSTLRHDEILNAAHAVDLSMPELRSTLSCENATAAIHAELEALRVVAGGPEHEQGMALAEADAALRRYVCEQVHLAIDRRTEEAYALSLAGAAAIGSAKRTVALREDVIAQLRTTSTSANAGSVAIIGPSGSGKSRLLEHLCGPTAHDNHRVLSAVVTANRNEPRDFVMHVLARLCRQVCDKAAADDVRLGREQRTQVAHADRVKLLWRRLGGVLSWGGACLIVVGAFHVRADAILVVGATCLVLAATMSRTGPSVTASDAAWRVGVARMVRRSSEQLPLIGVGVALISASQLGTSVDPLVVIGATALAIASAMRGPPKLLRRMTAGSRRGHEPPQAFPSRLVETATEVLDKLEHAETAVTTETFSRDSRLGRWVALRLGWISTTSVSRTPTSWTLDEVVARLEHFVHEDAKDLDIWIGIDLHRAEPEKWQSFLEGIDPLLRLQRERCLVLVSVLGEASHIPVLERRCDDVVALAPLTFRDSHALLRPEGSVVPMPFVALCHVLSGGVPQRLLDHAAVLDCKRAEGIDGMSEVARELVVGHLSRRAAHVQDRALSDGSPEASDVLDWARDVRAGCGSADALLALHTRRSSLWCRDPLVADPLPREAPPDRDLERLSDELAAHCYFAATVLAFFHDSMSRAAVDDALRGAAPPLEKLRDARSALSINPARATRLVAEFRHVCALESVA